MDDIEKLCVGQTKRLYFEDEFIGSFEIEKVFNGSTIARHLNIGTIDKFGEVIQMGYY